VDGRYVAVNVAVSARSARITDIFGINACTVGHKRNATLLT